MNTSGTHSLRGRMRALGERTVDYLLGKYAVYSQSKVYVDYADGESHFHFRLIFQFGEGSIGRNLVEQDSVRARIAFLQNRIDPAREAWLHNLNIPDARQGEKSVKADIYQWSAGASAYGIRYAEIDRELAPFYERMVQNRKEKKTAERNDMQFYIHDVRWLKSGPSLEYTIFALPDVLRACQFELFPDRAPLWFLAGFWIAQDGRVYLCEDGETGRRPLSLMNWGDYANNAFLSPFLQDLIGVKPSHEFLSCFPVRNLPIANTDRDMASNIRDLLSRTTGVACSRNVGRWDPVLALSYLMTIRHIHRNDRPLLYQFISDHPSRDVLIRSLDLNLSATLFKDNYEHFSLGVLFYYFFDRLAYGDVDNNAYDNTILIREYLRYSFRSHKYPNFRICSALRMMRELDDLQRYFTEERWFREEEVTFFDGYDVLASDEKYVFTYIRDKEHLIKESRELKLCLLSYASKINQGHCGFYAISEKGTEKRYVAELVYGEQRLMLNELKGQYNRAAPRKLGNRIRVQLKEVNNASPPLRFQKIESRECSAF